MRCPADHCMIALAGRKKYGVAPAVLHIITDLSDGGAQAALYRLIRQDRSARHVVVSLMDEGKYGPMLTKDGAQVVCLNMPRGRLTIGGLWRLWRLLKDMRPGIVQTWMYHADFVGGLLARMAGVRRVCWGVHHTTLEPGSSSRRTAMIAAVNARLSRWVPHCIVCCAEKAEKVHVGIGYTKDKMVVIPNGYDFKKFRPNRDARERLRHEWKISERQFVLGMVGRYDPPKDHSTLLAALARLRKTGVTFVCVLVGRGLVPENSAIVNQIKSYQLEGDVLLIGQRDDIPAVMNAIDVHVLSSSSEAFPNVLVEAMACGTPCVTTDVGDAALIVGENGWVVPPRNPDALAEAIQQAWWEWTNSNWATRQEAVRRYVVERFDIERMVKAYRRVWDVGES